MHEKQGINKELCLPTFSRMIQDKSEGNLQCFTFFVTSEMSQNRNEAESYKKLFSKAT